MPIAFYSEPKYWPFFLIFIYVWRGTGYSSIIYLGSITGISDEYYEAAVIDGATKWDVFTRITLPLSKPILVYTLLTSFIAPWTDFIFAKVIVGSDAKYYTVSVGLFQMLAKENIYQWYTCFAAGAVCVSIPIAILFIYVQRFYADGLSGAVKG